MTESAREWRASASSADEPVRRNAPALAAATSTFATNAVTTAPRCSDWIVVSGDGALWADTSLLSESAIPLHDIRRATDVRSLLAHTLAERHVG